MFDLVPFLNGREEAVALWLIVGLLWGLTRPAFEHDPNILQFVVEGYGWLEGADATEASLWDALASDTAERLTKPEPDDDTEES
jgi:hypothetical protein